MAYNDEDDQDLSRWLSSQQAPNLEASQPAAAGQGGGLWARAAQMLGDNGRAKYDPPPKPSATDSWATILGMLASKDPGSVLAQDASNRRQAVSDWEKRTAPDDSRQFRAAQLLMQEDAGKRATEGQQFEQERAMANDIERSANTDWTRQHTEGRDQATDAQNAIQNARADTGQAATIENMQASRSLQERGLSQGDKHFYDQIAATRGLHETDNAADLERARLAAAAKAAGNQVSALPGTQVTDPQAYQQFMQSPANVKDLTEHVGRANQVQAYVSQLRDLLKQPRTAAGEASYNSIIKQLIGDRSQEGSTGVLSNTEFARYIEDLPEYGVMGGMKNWRSALETVQGKNPRLSTLDALEKSLRAGQGAKLGAYGIQLGQGAAPPTQEQPPPAADVLPTTAPPRRNAPDATDYSRAFEDDDLGVKYGR